MYSMKCTHSPVLLRSSPRTCAAPAPPHQHWRRSRARPQRLRLRHAPLLPGACIFLRSLVERACCVPAARLPTCPAPCLLPAWLRHFLLPACRRSAASCTCTRPSSRAATARARGRCSRHAPRLGDRGGREAGSHPFSRPSPPPHRSPQVTTLVPSDPKKDLPRTPDGAIDYKRDFFGRPTMLTVSGQLQARPQSCLPPPHRPTHPARACRSRRTRRPCPTCTPSGRPSA